MNKPARTAKLEDVAVRAGVSTATVSRYINNPAVVSPHTGHAIAEAIAATGYIPNLIAGGLASSKSRMVAVLIPHLTDSIFNDTIEAMSDELASAGFTVLLGLTGPRAERSEDMVRAALARRVDAIIATAPLTDALSLLVERAPTLFLQIWELSENAPGVSIGFSHEDVGRDIARFLFARGYVRPHIVTADGPRARKRSAAFIDEWQAQAGREVSQTFVDIPSRFGHARRIYADLRRLEDMPDVVVTGSDYLAQGLIIEAQASGLRVPEELAVMGFGNSSLSGDMRPTITTVEIDGKRIAREAIAAIRTQSLGGEVATRMIDVGFRLVARESA
jgi:LacI family gluconate utilization system Gnt-I transcriptional repressor